MFRDYMERVGTGIRLMVNEMRQCGLRMLQERGSITSREYAEATGVSERTALRELREMVARGVIAVCGRTRSARYFLP